MAGRRVQHHRRIWGAVQNEGCRCFGETGVGAGRELRYSARSPPPPAPLRRTAASHAPGTGAGYWCALMRQARCCAVLRWGVALQLRSSDKRLEISCVAGPPSVPPGIAFRLYFSPSSHGALLLEVLCTGCWWSGRSEPTLRWVHPRDYPTPRSSENLRFRARGCPWRHIWSYWGCWGGCGRQGLFLGSDLLGLLWSAWQVLRSRGLGWLCRWLV